MKLSRSHIICYRVLLCISLAVITYLATTALEFTFVSPMYDKINHFAAFFVLALLVDFSFPNSRFNTVKIVSLIVYGFFIGNYSKFLTTQNVFVI